MLTGEEAAPQCIGKAPQAPQTRGVSVLSSPPGGAKKNSATMSWSWEIESQLLTRTRNCEPPSKPFEYQLQSALILLITQRSRPRAVGGWRSVVSRSSVPGAT